MKDEQPRKPPRHREPKGAADRLRNLYRSGDETGKTKPDKGETFQGLERKKRRGDDR